MRELEVTELVPETGLGLRSPDFLSRVLKQSLQLFLY